MSKTQSFRLWILQRDFYLQVHAHICLHIHSSCSQTQLPAHKTPRSLSAQSASSMQGLTPKTWNWIGLILQLILREAELVQSLIRHCSPLPCAPSAYRAWWTSVWKMLFFQGAQSPPASLQGVTSCWLFQSFFYYALVGFTFLGCLGFFFSVVKKKPSFLVWQFISLLPNSPTSSPPLLPSSFGQLNKSKK